MALAYFDVARRIVAPDNRPLQNEMLLEQATIRLISGKGGPSQSAELAALLSESRSFNSIGLGTLIDFEAGRPEDALARIEAITPRCFTADSFETTNQYCPTELVRVYQKLGDHAAARDLADEIIRYLKLWADGVPWDGYRAQYAGALAAAGQSDEALGVLESLVSSGWRGNYYFFLRFALYFDVNSDAIRDDERFQAIAAVIEADMAQQLENVREMERNGEIPTLEEVRQMTAAATDTL